MYVLSLFHPQHFSLSLSLSGARVSSVSVCANFKIGSSCVVNLIHTQFTFLLLLPLCIKQLPSEPGGFWQKQYFLILLHSIQFYVLEKRGEGGTIYIQILPFPFEGRALYREREREEAEREKYLPGRECYCVYRCNLGDRVGGRKEEEGTTAD